MKTWWTLQNTWAEIYFIYFFNLAGQRACSRSYNGVVQNLTYSYVGTKNVHSRGCSIQSDWVWKKNKTQATFSCLQLNKVSKDLPGRPYSEIAFPETFNSGVWIQTPYFSNYLLFSYPLFCVDLSNTIPAKYIEVCCCKKKKTKFKSYEYRCEALGSINHHPSDALFLQSPGITGKSSTND